VRHRTEIHGSRQQTEDNGLNPDISALLALLVWMLASGQVRASGVAQGMTRRFNDKTKALVLAEATLQERNRFKVAILDSMSAQIAVLDDAGVIIAVNESWRRFALENSTEPGKPAASTGVGVNYLDICRAGDNESSEGAAAALNGILQVMGGLLPSFSIEYACHSPQQQRWFIMSVTPLGGESGGVVIAHTDISSRIQAEAALRSREERFQILFDGAGEGILIASAGGKLVAVNASFARMHGYTPQEMSSMHLQELDTAESLDRLPERMQRIMAGESITFEVEHYHKDGHVFPLEVSSSLIHTGGESLVQAFHRDITRRKEGEAEIARHRDHLEELVHVRTAELESSRDAALAGNVAKSEFLAAMSHELRTPMNAIIGFSEILRDGVLGELSAKQREYVGEIFVSGSNLLSLINNILDLAKLAAGKMTLTLAPVAVALLVQSVLKQQRENAAARRVQLVVDIVDGLSEVWLDQGKVEQIVDNLLSNAIKFSPAGGEARITARHVGAEAVPGGNFDSYLELAVSDTGIGISAADQAKLFKPFIQVDSSLARRYNGTGLGLVMVKRLADLHGGATALQSAAGQGAKFTVWLPWRTEERRKRAGVGASSP
jgi:PAS domain S-box-containing protein